MGGFAPMGGAPITGPTNPMIQGMNPSGYSMQGLLENPMFGMGLGLLSANVPSTQAPNYAQGIMGGLQMSQSAQGARQRQEMQKASYDMQMKQLAQQQQEWTAKQSEAARMEQAQAELTKLVSNGAKPEEIAAALAEMGDYSLLTKLNQPPPAGSSSALGTRARELMEIDPTLTPAAARAKAQDEIVRERSAGASNISVGGAAPFKLPTGYMLADPNNPALGMVPAPGSPDDPAKKALTESQSNATMFYNRAKEMDQSMSSGGYDATGLRGGWDRLTTGPSLTNWMASEEGQQYINQGKNFVASVLRKESGAAITTEEWASGQQLYVDMPGDSAALKKQKAENRRLAIEGLQVSSGPGAARVGGGATGGWGEAPNVDSLLEKYK